MSKHLLGNICVETKNASLNGSKKENENIHGGFDNISFCKKISINKDKYPYASACQISRNILKTLKTNFGHNLAKVKLNGKQAMPECHPAKNIDEDIRGFMFAGTAKLSEEEYEEKTEKEQSLYKATKKNNKTTYTLNVTKKRKACLQLTPLQAIQPTKIQTEFGVCITDKDNCIYNKEVYAGYMSYSFNFDLTNVGKFKVSEDSSGFRDYDEKEAKSLGLNIDENNNIILDKKIRLKRISDTLRAMQFYNSNVRQTSNLEDLTPKFVILGEYSIGNNIFNNIFRNGELDIEYLKEAIFENEPFRTSSIFIGVRTGFMPGIKENLIDMGKQLEEKNINIKIGTIKEAFDKYIEHVEKTLE